MKKQRKAPIYSWASRMRVEPERTAFYGFAYGYRVANRRYTRPHFAQWIEHTCTLSGEQRLLNAIFNESQPCCQPTRFFALQPPRMLVSSRHAHKDV